MDKNEKVRELFLDASFKDAVKNVKTAEELKEKFSDFGLDLDIEEVVDLCGKIAERIKCSSECEISEETVDSVTGGVAWALVGLGVVCIGGAALGIYNGYQEAKRSENKNKSK